MRKGKGEGKKEKREKGKKMPSRFVDVTSTSPSGFNFTASLPPLSWPFFNLTSPVLNQTTVHEFVPRPLVVQMFAMGLGLLILERLWVWLATRRFLSSYGSEREDKEKSE